MELEKRGRGRPPGMKNGEGKGPAPIKRWKPWMTKIVIMHMAGYSNEAISHEFPSKHNPEKFISVVRVSQIISDPQGQQMIKGMNVQVKNNMMSELESGMLVLAHKGMGRMAETLDEKFTPGSDAKKHQDNLSLNIAKNFVVGEAEARKASSPQLPAEVLNRFSAALEKVAQVREIQAAQALDPKKEIVLLQQKAG